MSEIRLACNLVKLTSDVGLDYGHSSLVYVDGASQTEIEVQSPRTYEVFPNWVYEKRDHTNLDNTPGYSGEVTGDYAWVTLDFGERKAKDVWGALEAIHGQFSTDGLGITYTPYQNCSSYVNTLLYMVGVDFATYLPMATPANVTDGFPGATTNVVLNNATAFAFNLTLTDGADLLQCGVYGDTIDGGKGNDTLVGGVGQDELRGGDDDDKLYGDAKKEDDDGNGNNDILIGGKGKDSLYGGMGVDNLSGEDDDDTLDGNGGSDMLLGAKGTDKYIYTSKGGGTDWIKDEREGDQCLGSVEYDQSTLGGGKAVSKGAHTWKSADGKFIYQTTGDPNEAEVTLYITGGKGGKLTVFNFKNHDLGIHLRDGDPGNGGNGGSAPPPDAPANSGGNSGAARRRDPLLLDLTGNGITTLGLEAGLHFDQNNDGLKEGSGWAGLGTGLLMLDRNADGRLTDGGELFGDATPVNGGIPVSGFAALAQYDRNGDNRIDAGDPVWSQLKVWRHSSNPVTGETLIDDPDYAGELVGLDELGIVAIRLDATATSSGDANAEGNGNTQLSHAILEMADGSTRTIAEYSLARNGQDTVAASRLSVDADIQVLPDLHGMGGTFDLHQAMQQNPALKALVQQFVAATDATARQAAFEQIIYTWTGVAEVSPTARGNQMDARHVAALEVFYGKALGTPNFEDAVAWELTWRRLSEGFYASLEAQTHLTDAMSHVSLATDANGYVTGGDLTGAIAYFSDRFAADPASAQTELADFARTIKGYGLGTSLDWLKFREAMKTQDDALGWLMDSAGLPVVEMYQDNGHYISFRRGNYDSEATISYAPQRISDGVINSVGGDDVVYGRDDPLAGDYILQENGNALLVGRAGNDFISAGGGDDYLEGDSGDDVLYGETGNDTLDGGSGNDVLAGGAGNDTYIFRRGDGQDTINEFGSETNTVYLAGLMPGDITATMDWSGRLVMRVAGTTDTLTIGGFYGFGADTEPDYRFVFEDGTVWTRSDLVATYQGTDADDTQLGGWRDDVLQGLGGNDQLDGGVGNDTIIGGTGDDVLSGGSASTSRFTDSAGEHGPAEGSGNNVFIFNRGDGNDRIKSDWAIRATDQSDTLRFGTDITPADVTLVCRDWNLVAIVANDGGSVTMENWFTRAHHVGNIEFADGTVWDADILQAAPFVGTDDADKIVGAASDDQMFAQDGDDDLRGMTGQDSLDGGAGDDTLAGGLGDDTFVGGAGNDLLAGNYFWSSQRADQFSKEANGNDVYVFGRDGGQDVVYDRDATTGNIDTIRLIDGLTPADVTLTHLGGDLLIALGDGSNSMTVKNAFLGEDWRIEQLVFDDGTVWDWATIQNLAAIRGTDDADYLAGTADSELIEAYAGDDTLAGGNGNDTLAGGEGDDVLLGRAGDEYTGSTLTAANGDDTYLFGAGDGHDTVIDRDNTAGNTDTVLLKDGVTPDDVVLRKRGNDMVLTLTSTGDSLTMRDWFLPVSRIERLQFADGTVWDVTQMQARSVLGGPDDDLLIGSDVADVIDGAAGHDTLIGGLGDDIYRFGFGAGQDLIGERAATGLETIALAAGVAVGDVTVRRMDDDLVLTLTGGADVLTVSSWFADTGADARIDVVRFADGTTWTPADLRLLALAGTADAETLTGYDSNDTLAGLGGDDVLKGGDGDDVYLFARGDGWDTLTDTAGTDRIQLDSGIAVSDVSLSLDNNDLLVKIGAEGMRITNFTGAGRIEYLEFADGTVWSADAMTVMAGPATNGDLLLGTPQADTLAGGDGTDTILADAGDDVLMGNAGDDQLVGGTGADTLTGGAGNDTLYGSGLADMETESGADVLDGGAGDDTIYAGGNDTVWVTRGGGFDTVRFAEVREYDDATGEFIVTPKTVRFGPGINRDDLSVQVSSGGGDGENAMLAIGIGDGEGMLLQIPGIWDLNQFHFVFEDGTELFGSDIWSMTDEGVIGYQERYSEDSGDMWGSVARDEIHGGDWEDRIDARDNADFVDAGAGDDTITGGRGNDTLLGGTGSNRFVFNRGDGDDVIKYQDTDEFDTVMFGAGVLPGDVSVRVADDGVLVLTVTGAGGGSLTFMPLGDGAAGVPLASIEFVDADGQVSGIDFQAFLAANQDILLTGVSAALSDIPNGIDLVRTDTEGTSGDDLLAGSAEGDVLVGNAGDDILLGGAGTDFLDGGDGDDTYVYRRGDGEDYIDDSASAIGGNAIHFDDASISLADLDISFDDAAMYIDLGNGDRIVVGGVAGQEFAGNGPIRRFIFADGSSVTLASLFGDTHALAGTDEADLLVGTDEADYFVPLAGDDTLIGGLGNDVYKVAAEGGVDTITDIARENAGNALVLDMAASDAANLKLSWDGADAALLLNLADGSQIRLSGFDQDTPWGAHAIETYHLGTDGPVLSYADLIARGFDIVGTDGNDRLLGTAATDRITGDAGNDTLESGAGNDTLAGGTGDDTYVYNRGDGILTIDDIASATEGNTLSFGADITVGDLARALRYVAPTDSAPGVFTIRFGDSGDEVRMLGFDPANPRFGQHAIDYFRFADGTVMSYAEVLQQMFVVQGDETANTLSGTALGDRLYGYEANDVLEANAGDDVLTGGSGADTLRGGDGRDAYVFNRGDGVDVIDDSNADSVGNILTFAPEITHADLSFSYEGTTLVIRYGMGDEIRILGQNGANGAVVDTLELLADNSSVSLTDTVAAALNLAPTLAGLVDAQAADEDSVWQYTLPAGLFADPEGGVISLTACLSNGKPLPSWLAFDAATGTFSGTPENVDVGTLGIQVAGTDRYDATVTTSFSLAINNTNDAPVAMLELADAEATQATLFSYALPAGLFGDADKGDVLTCSATLADGSSLPAWLTFDAATGCLSGTPANADVGNLAIKVMATDLAGATTSATLAVTVNNVNDAPVCSIGLSDVTIRSGSALAIDLPAGTFTDVDADDSLTYAACLVNGASLPGWLIVDPVTGLLSGLPGNSDAGQLSIVMTATDLSGATATGQFILTVTNAGSAPIVANQIGDQSASQGQVFNFVLPDDAFSDPDAALGDTMSYSVTLADGSALPSWLSFDALARTFSGVPENDDVGTLQLRVTACDNQGAAVSDFFSLSVLNANDAPTAGWQPADISINEGTPLLLTVPADAFADVDAGDVLTLSATLADGSPLPAWLAFDPVTRTLSGTPDDIDLGTIRLRIVATDSAGALAATAFDLSIANVNDAPTVAQPLIDQVALEETEFQFVLPENAFIDIDAGDALTYIATLADGNPLPAWLAFDVESRRFSGTPANSDVGTLTVKVTATDRYGVVAEQSFVMMVEDVNDAPDVLGEVCTIEEDTGLIIKTSALLANDSDTDLTGDMLTVASVGNAIGGEVFLNDVGQVVFVPLVDLNGAASFDYSVSDGRGGLATATVAVDITAVNDAPLASASLANQTIKVGDAFAYALPDDAFTDVDAGDALVWQASLSDGTPLPSWLNYDVATHAFYGTPSVADAGDFQVRITATDLAGASVSQQFDMTVNNSNDVPQAENDTASVSEDGRRVTVGNALHNDTDPEGRQLHVDDAGIQYGSYGMFSIFGNGGYAYLLDNGSTAVQSLGEGESVVDQFGYLASNGVGSVAAEVAITINGRNDRPDLETRLSNRSYMPGTQVSFGVAENFSDVDTNDVLVYSARLTNGSHLPEWLTFDTTTGVFSGSVPKKSPGSLEIRVTASDGHGKKSSVSDVFKIGFGKAGVDKNASQADDAHVDHGSSSGWQNQGYDENDNRDQWDRDEHTVALQNSLGRIFARSDIDLEAVEQAMAEFDRTTDERHRQESRWENVGATTGTGESIPSQWTYMDGQLNTHLYDEEGGYDSGDMANGFGGADINRNLLAARNVLSGSPLANGVQSFQSLQGLQEGVTRLG